jgi:excisionase family DNA binding protein
MTAPLTPLAVTIGEACRISGLGVTSIYDLLKEGRLQGHKIGRRRLVSYKSLQDLLEGNATSTDSGAEQEQALAASRPRGRPRKHPASGPEVTP